MAGNLYCHNIRPQTPHRYTVAQLISQLSLFLVKFVSNPVVHVFWSVISLLRLMDFLKNKIKNTKCVKDKVLSEENSKALNLFTS